MNKHEMRKAAIKRLKRHVNCPGYYQTLIKAIIGEDYDELTGSECVEAIINLLSDDEPQYKGDAFAKGPRDADGVLWFSGDMSDSPWGVIEYTFFDGEQWLVCGHDISAPWVPADSIRHAPMRTATQREDDLIKLPKDANGEVIHIGDEVIVNGCGRRLTVAGVGRSDPHEVVFCVNESGYDVWVAKSCHHYHKPTVDEILDELEGMRGTGDYDAVVERCADLAGMLRELLKEGEDE